jgi:hypothetical protein
MENKLISVSGWIFDNARDAAREISKLSHHLALIAIAARILRRVMKRRAYGFPVSRKHRHETYMNWICGKDY